MLHFMIGLGILVLILSVPIGRVIVFGGLAICAIALVLILSSGGQREQYTRPPPPPISQTELAANAKLPCTTAGLAKPGQPVCPPPPPPEHLDAECTETNDLFALLPGEPQDPLYGSSRNSWFNSLPKAHRNCVLDRLYRGLDQLPPEARSAIFAADATCKTDDTSRIMLDGPNTAWFKALPAAQQDCIRAGAMIALHKLPTGSTMARYLAFDTSCQYLQWTIQREPFPGPARVAYWSALPKAETDCMGKSVSIGQRAR